MGRISYNRDVRESIFSSRLAGTRCVMIRAAVCLSATLFGGCPNTTRKVPHGRRRIWSAIVLASVLMAFPSGRASGQLEVPKDLFFAPIPPETKALVEQLYVSREPARQVEAAGKLAALGEAAAPVVPYLVTILNENIDPTVRQAVVATLIKLGKPVLDPIKASLKAKREETRLSAIEILETLVDKSAAAPLTDVALHDAAAPVRDRALGALARLATTDPAVSQKLIATVEDEKEKPEIRSRAMKALGKVSGMGLPLDALVAMLENAEADIRLRCAAAAALGQSRNVQAVSPLVRALADDKAPIRLWAAVALNGNSSAEVVAALVKALDDEDDRVRVRAADALAGVLDPKVLDPLVKATGDTNAEVRTWAVIGLGNYTDKKALDALVAALRDTEVEVRVAAADSLGRTGSPEATPHLIARFNDFAEQGEVRAAAARAVGGLRDSRAVPALLGLLSDNDPKVRQWVASALGRIGDSRAVDPLIGALSDSDPAVRGWAALALARFRDRRIIDPLLKAAKDSEAQVRARVVLALQVAANDPRVKAALQEAAADPDPTVQENAKKALAQK